MRIIFENNHAPAIRKYRDAFVQDLQANAYYVYDDQGTYYAVPGANYMGAFVSAPSAAPTGAMYYNTTNDTMYVRDGDTWESAEGPAGADGTIGADGADGSKWYTNTGAPSGGTGVVGDFYLNATNGDFYEKTGVSTWTLKGNLKGATGAAGSNGSNGSNGANGADGKTGGVRYTFSTTITDSDPGTGVIRYNSATAASITRIYIDNADAGGVSQTAWYDVMDDSTSTVKGYLIVISDAGGYAVFAVTGVTAASGYYKLDVTRLTGAVPSNTAGLSVLFVRNGDKGDTGSAGATGSVWFSGSGAPDNGDGANGDYYLNTANGDVYHKSGSAWGSPILNITGPAGAGSGDMVKSTYDPANKNAQLAADSEVVHNTGTETIAGAKTFSSDVVVPDEAYDGTNWNGSLEVPTKNAVRDKMENMQPLDSDLTAIAALAPTNDDIIQRKSGAWTNRTMAQLKTDLALTKSDVGLSSVTNDAQIKSADFPSSSVDNELALFSSTSGKVLKRATTTGMLKATSGVLSAATAGTDYYNPGGTDVALADGGTGASLTDPGANTLLGWDDTDNAVRFLTLGSGLSYDHATHTLSAPGGGGGGGGAPQLIVAANGAATAWTSAADYQCDGTADDTDISSAVTACISSGGGEIILSPGTFNLAAAIAIAGNDDYDGPQVIIRGQGTENTILKCGSNITAITLTSSARVKIEDMTIDVNGSGHGISSTHGGTLTRGFHWSEFRNLYFSCTAANHSGWGMNLGNPFRSVFENIEMFEVANGIKMFSQDSDFNPGDLTVNRMFIELSGNSRTAIQLDANTTGQFNQTVWDMVEMFANGTGCTGILLSGAGADGGPAHNRFKGVNIEQFDTLIDVQTGEGNIFECNYIEARNAASMSIFKTGTAAWNNRFSAGFCYIPSSRSHALITDANTSNPSMPNRFENIHVLADTSSTVTKSVVEQTIYSNIFNDGAGNASAVLKPARLVNPHDTIALTDGATPALDASKGNRFRLTAAGDRTIAVPSNPTSDQEILIEHVASGGARTLALNTGTGGFAYGSDITGLTQTASGKTDFIMAKYNATANKWRVIAYVKGY